MSTQLRSPKVDELSCVPETQQSQQAAGVEELVVRVEDPLEMLDTEQGDVVLETQQDSDSSNEDITDTQSAGGWGWGDCAKKGKSRTREGQHVSEEEKAQKRSKKPTGLFTTEEQKLVDLLRDNEILYNKRSIDYKDRLKREAVWDKFCNENNMNKDAC